jgi:ABC-type multidrug transport system fused ATPase/permease subunit
VLRGAVDELPIWLLLIVVVGALVGLVVLLVWSIRRLVPVVAEGFDAEVASQMLGVVAALFGLLLAFIIVIAYENYTDAQSNVTGEADALAAIVRDSAAFPPSERERVHASIGAYVRAVVEEEWSRMREGDDSPRAWTAVDGIFVTLQGIEPTSPSAVAFYDDSVRQLNVALDARRNRLDDAGGGLPWVIGALLFVGSLVIVGYAVLIGSRSYSFHAIGAGSIAVIIGMSLVVLVALIYPFSGDLAIDSEPFQNGILAQFFGAS